LGFLIKHPTYLNNPHFVFSVLRGKIGGQRQEYQEQYRQSLKDLHTLHLPIVMVMSSGVFLPAPTWLSSNVGLENKENVGFNQ